MESFTIEQVTEWLKENQFEQYIADFEKQKIDGKVLLTLSESDLKEYLNFQILGDIRRLISLLKKKTKPTLIIETKEAQENTTPRSTSPVITTPLYRANSPLKIQKLFQDPSYWSAEDESWGSSLTKLFVSFLFTIFTIFLTAITMVVAHEKVPNPTTYPPLPDFILDNIDRIPIAFELAEVCILCLSIILLVLLMFHKHRLIIIRRMSVIIGVVFLLRCLTMFITSLSVPGKHLTNCANAEVLPFDEKLFKAWKITKGLGLSISGVYTCGDYMFSGHTIILTMFNHFICEYTRNEWKGLHIITWIFNFFGMFFILAAHEHYSIDVFIAFYISSRVFTNYHTVANLHYSVKNNTGTDLLAQNFYFPLIGYLEEHTKGVIPNDFEIPLISKLFNDQ